MCMNNQVYLRAHPMRRTLLTLRDLVCTIGWFTVNRILLLPHHSNNNKALLDYFVSTTTTNSKCLRGIHGFYLEKHVVTVKSKHVSYWD